MTPVKRSKRQKKRTSLVLLVRGMMLAAGLLPYRAAAAIGSLLGRIAYRLLPKERGRALENLRAVFPDRDERWVRGTARQVFRHLGIGLFETLAMDRMRLGTEVVIDGMQRLEAALARGKGVVYVTGHIGTWELMAAAVAQTHPVSVIAAPLKPEPMNDMVVALRERLGVRTIVRSRPGAAKELIRVFRENRILGILIDQDTDVEGAFVDFMGRPAWTPTAAAQMAARFEAPVMYGYDLRLADGRHRVTMEGPLELVTSGSEKQDIIANTAMLTRLIVATILRNPEQWVWMHRRWRRRP